MRVGIQTLPLLDNYGGLLQAAGLYREIVELGHEPVLLSKKYYRPRLQRRIASILRAIPGHNVQGLRELEARRAVHYPFLDQCLPNRTGPLYTRDELAAYVHDAGLDAVVVGSDQVWRSSYLSDEDVSCYFLDIPVRKKIAYAASLGNDGLPSADRVDRVRALVDGFDAISVRERSAQSLIMDEMFRGSRKVDVALDPTLLVETGFFESLAAPPAESEQYVLSYILDPHHRGLGVEGKVLEAIGPNLAVRNLGLASGGSALTVAAWLRAFRSASFVVTDSYHGSIFAILFGKPFLAIANEERGVARFSSLFGQLDLLDRLLFADSLPDVTDLVARPTNYESVHRRIDELRTESRSFLRDALLAL